MIDPSLSLTPLSVPAPGGDDKPFAGLDGDWGSTRDVGVEGGGASAAVVTTSGTGVGASIGLSAVLFPYLRS